MAQPKVVDFLKNMSPYKGGHSSIQGRDRVIKLSSNEGALGPSPQALDAVHMHQAQFQRYPISHPCPLTQALAKSYHLDPDGIILGAGSDDLIHLIVRAYATVGDEVLYSQYGFLMYAICARQVGARPVCAPEKDLTLCVDAMVDAVTEKTKIVFVANPNNPTGTMVPFSEIERLRAQLPEHILLVIDGAYAEFVMGNQNYESGERLVEQTSNTIMLRTFSKIYGLAALRLGWGYFPPQVAQVIHQLRSPFNVSSMARCVGLAAFEDEQFTQKVRRHTDQTRQWFVAQVKGLSGMKIYDSVCNFVLLSFDDARQADAHLRDQGVIVRDVSDYGLKNFLRITIGTREEMQGCLDALRLFSERVSHH